MTQVVAQEFLLLKSQTTIWTPGLELPLPKVLGYLLDREGERLDGDPVCVPPDQAHIQGGPVPPSDIPRLVLPSRSGEWRLQIAAGRMDVHWSRPKKQSADPDGLVRAKIVEGWKMLAPLRDLLAAPVDRVATVIERFARNPEPGRFLARHFCDDRWKSMPLNRPEGFELHAHKRFDMSGFTVNSWVRSRAAGLTVDGNSFPVILVLQDLNTPSEADARRSFEAHEIDQFYQAAGAELDAIMTQYYPEDSDA